MGTPRATASRSKQLQRAWDEEPEGCVCGFCGAENDNADDVGFWYLYPDPAVEDERAACDKCFKIYYPAHAKRYGVGER